MGIRKVIVKRISGCYVFGIIVVVIYYDVIIKRNFGCLVYYYFVYVFFFVVGEFFVREVVSIWYIFVVECKGGW